MIVIQIGIDIGLRLWWRLTRLARGLCFGLRTNCHNGLLWCWRWIIPAAEAYICQALKQAFFLARRVFGNMLDAVLLGRYLLLRNGRKFFDGRNTLAAHLRFGSAWFFVAIFKTLLLRSPSLPEFELWPEHAPVPPWGLA